MLASLSKSPQRGGCNYLLGISLRNDLKNFIQPVNSAISAIAPITNAGNNNSAKASATAMTNNVTVIKCIFIIRGCLVQDGVNLVSNLQTALLVDATKHITPLIRRVARSATSLLISLLDGIITSAGRSFCILNNLRRICSPNTSLLLRLLPNRVGISLTKKV